MMKKPATSTKPAKSPNKLAKVGMASGVQLTEAELSKASGGKINKLPNPYGT